ncbi:RNA polymerase sigma-70 factor, ECF subfamily [Singulisphaera sp. GP187]|uniref:RNA polymerase sigma factor n=1 Tax=Singulisphaera sp. GP187 TaxID=1882752 RepID=UPI000927FDF7|nr:sigma-70 family RNA polymerase sigma factor [Singulisphaera sp. GP187]SIO35319.1 RNA polymerase sigma-70 factor, ECF subfamily [Singulisphaera sp. GP187]
MTSGPSGALLMKQLRALCDGGAVGGLADGPLLDRFLGRRDASAEAAFGALVERHGPMVFRVCRAILRDPHDAEDASQAVFLILARRAGAIRNRDSVASWLFGVACRVSARAKVDAARRREREWRGAERAAQTASADRGSSEARERLYEELERLPEAYRAVIVLCDLEGLTHEQAAHQLRGSVRTVQRRLEQGRQRLRRRLSSQTASLASGLPIAPEAVSAACVETTARAAVWFVTNPGMLTAGSVPASVVTLAEGVLKTMALNTLKLTAIACFSAGIVAGGLVTQVRSAAGPPPAASPPRTEIDPGPRVVAALAPAEKEKEKAKEAVRELTLDDGKPAGKKSIAGSGHAVRFESPGDGWTLTSVRLHGSRYGYPKPPNEDFTVYLCDENFQQIAAFPFPYSTFKRGPEDWVRMALKPTKVPAKFIVCVGFNPAATKGVYVSHDGQKKKKDGDSPSSFTGLPGDTPQPFAQGNWLIRVRLEPPKKAGTSG